MLTLDYHYLFLLEQDQVDNADSFPEVLKKVKDWFREKQLGTKYRFAVSSDGYNY
jgi:3'-5' exoribonuclease 1